MKLIDPSAAKTELKRTRRQVMIFAIAAAVLILGALIYRWATYEEEPVYLVTHQVDTATGVVTFTAAEGCYLRWIYFHEPHRLPCPEMDEDGFIYLYDSKPTQISFNAMELEAGKRQLLTFEYMTNKTYEGQPYAEQISYWIHRDQESDLLVITLSDAGGNTGGNPNHRYTIDNPKT